VPDRRSSTSAALLALILLLAGCSAGSRQSAKPAWTLRVSNSDHVVLAFADIVVVTSLNSIVGVDRRTGQQRWIRPAGAQDRVVATSDLLAQYDDSGIALFDPATGKDRWRASAPHGQFAVYQTAVYVDDCGPGSAASCVLTARDVHTGQPQWTLPANYGFRRSTSLHALPVPRYLVARMAQQEPSAALVDTDTGKPLPGRATNSNGWYALPAGELMVATDDSDSVTCAVTLTAADGRTGAQRWTVPAYTGRKADGECIHPLEEYQSGWEAIGAGTRLAACDSTGKPVVVDLTTGATVWTGSAPGTPVDGDATGVLAVDTAGQSGIAFYDLATGRRQWTAPDPGLNLDAASQTTAVTGARVAITGTDDGDPIVVVLDRATGKQLGTFRNRLSGVGDDWVAVTHGVHGDLNKADLDFIPM
jgi:outer membrane protein assembly factor BamB